MAQPSQAKKPRAKELPKVLSKDEAAALLAMPNLNVPTGLRDRCMLQLMYRNGFRVTETCLFGVRDVNWSEQVIHLRPEITKGGKEAYAPFDDATGALLERWKFARREYAAGKPTFFTTLQGGPVDRRAVYKMVVRRARKAGIDRHIHPHMLRHTFATELLAEGVELRVVQELMRHSDIRTTTLYTHIASSQLADVIRRRA
jgi:site-specific recombinase XerD